uniref:Uncharacterized protein n=1 Tax=Anguilla anguilla TaxID=7936 RepID=A0A0E9XZG6_ANGAN
MAKKSIVPALDQSIDSFHFKFSGTKPHRSHQRYAYM